MEPACRQVCGSRHRDMLCAMAAWSTSSGTADRTLQAQSSAAEALKKARALERLADEWTTTSTSSTGAGLRRRSGVAEDGCRTTGSSAMSAASPSTQRDHIWVYHRPRALSSTDSGAQGVAGKDDAGNPISALGFRRPYGRLLGVLRPGAIGARVRQGRQPACRRGADPAIPASSRRGAASRMAAPGRRASTASSSTTTTSSTSSGNGQARDFHGQFPVGGEFRQRLAHAEVHARRHVRLSDRHGRREGAEQQRHATAASTARRSRIWWPT